MQQREKKNRGGVARGVGAGTGARRALAVCVVIVRCVLVARARGAKRSVRRSPVGGTILREGSDDVRGS